MHYQIYSKHLNTFSFCQTVQTTAEGTPFSGSMNAVFCDF